MEKSLEERVAEIEEDFSELGEWLDKYQYLAELGKETDDLSDEEKNAETLIHGCQSDVWILSEKRDGRIYFRGDGDALIVKGIVSLLKKAVSGCTIDEVRGYDFGFIERIGLREHLTPNRSNGLLSMIERIKRLAE